MQYTIWLCIVRNDETESIVNDEHIITFNADSDEEAIERMTKVRVKAL